MFVVSLAIAVITAATGVSITEPADGATYNGDWLAVNAIVENQNEIPDSVHYSLNGGNHVAIPRLNTDWYTYRGNDYRTGYSQSPAPEEYSRLWSTKILGFLTDIQNEPVVADGIVYYPQSPPMDSLYALDAATGSILWKYRVGYTVDAVTVKNGYVYTASDSLFCLDAYTGERIWAHYRADYQAGTPVVTGGVVYSGTASMNQNTSWIYCVNAYTGADLWDVSVPGFTASSMTLWNGILFVPTFNGPLYAINAASGAVLWQNTDCTLGYWESSPVVVEDYIYICDFDSNLRAIDPSDGTTVWYQTVSPGTHISATPAYQNNRLYFGDQVDSFHCFDASNGSSIWSFDAPAMCSASLADGKVFFGEGSSYYRDEQVHFYCLDWDSGEVIWERNASGLYGIAESSAISDGMIYSAGFSSSYLYAVGTGIKYTYRDDLLADTGSNQLIVTSFNEGVPVAADTISFTVTGTGIDLDPSTIFNLSASPNPFAVSASVTFELASPAFTSVEIFDLSGRKVTSLADSHLSAGSHSLEWNGTYQTGEEVAAGLYICRIVSGNVVETTGLCLLK